MGEMTKLSWIFGTALVLGVSVFALHEEKEADTGDAKMTEMLEELMKFAAPGEHHKRLASLEGSWKMHTRFRQAPDAPWSDGVGPSKNEWVLGGRFLQSIVHSPPSESMPFPFEGLGLLGHDNFGGEYISLWMDSFMTGVMAFKGGADASGKVITVKGEFANPAKGGQIMKSRWVYRIINDDKYIFEMWEPDEGGKEYLHGEITFSRVR